MLYETYKSDTGKVYETYKSDSGAEIAATLLRVG